jgi:uncharacterized membrane protein
MKANPMTIEDYLKALRRAFGKAPPGLIADALADAEEHLRGAMAAHPEQSEAEAISHYGAPEDVAAEYLATESRSPGPFARAPQDAATPAVHRPYPGLFGVVRDPVTYGALFYMLLSLVTGIFFFTWAVAGISLSLGLAILVIGVPFFLLFVGSVRLLALLEGRIVEGLLGVRMPRRLPAAAADQGLWPRIRNVLADIRTWSSLLYMLIMMPLGIAYSTMAVTGLATSLALLVFGWWHLFHLGETQIIHGCDGGGVNCGFSFHEVGFGVTHLHNPPAWLESIAPTPLPSLLALVAAVLVFFLTLHLARLAGWLQGRIAEHLLVRL